MELGGQGVVVLAECESLPLSPGKPDGQLPGPAPTLAGLTHEHRLPHPALLPLVPGSSCFPLLCCLAVSGSLSVLWPGATSWHGTGNVLSSLRVGLGAWSPSLFSRVRPSSTCGPFRTLNTMYEAGTVWVRRLERAGSGASWLPWLHHLLVENTFFLFLASALLL